MDNFIKNMSRKHLVYLFFSVLITVSIFYYLFSQISLSEVWGLILGVDRRALYCFVFLAVSMSFFRTWRYLLLLWVVGYRPSALAFFLVVLVRNFFSDLLPARIGSLIYIYVVTARLGIPFASATSSFALSFLFDIVALVPLILIALIMAGSVESISLGGLLAGSVVLGVISVLLIKYLAWFCKIMAQWVKKYRGEHNKIFEFLCQTESDIEKVKTAGIFNRLIVLSLLVRITKYASLYIFVYALLKPIGYGFEDLHVAKVLLGICASELAASLPISGIAGFGAYEGAWALTFTMLGFEEKIASLTAVSHHLFTQVYGYSLGALALLLLLLPFFKSPDQVGDGNLILESGVVFYGKVLLAGILVASILFYIIW